MSGRDAAVILMGALLGLGVPWLGMRMLEPSLAEGPRTANYRGRSVYAGLGVVWLLWAGAAIVGGVFGADTGGERTSLLPILTLAGPLALVAFALGLVDDAYGTGASRGFRGHLRALRHGRLTTGGLKLFGISLASYVVAFILAQAAGWGDSGLGLALLYALPAGAAIALTANFVNLCDLRPGRALKVYAVLALGGLVAVIAGMGNVADTPVTERLVDGLVLLLFLAGPLLATWRFDLGELGMLGDSGANAAGAVTGLLIVAGLPFWGVLIYLALVLALNLASERFSFSGVIEKSALLSRIDSWGRLPAEESSRDS